jgi:hypothetical protein
VSNVVEPPPRWRVTGWMLLAMAGLCAGAVAVVLYMWIRLYGLVAGSSPGTGFTSRSDLMFGDILVTVLPGVVIIVFLGTYLAWHRSWRQLADRYGADGRRVVRHWAVTTWRILFVGAIVLSYLPLGLLTGAGRMDGIGTGEVLAFVRYQIVFAAIRLVSLVFLLVGVVAVRRRMSGLIDGGATPVSLAPARTYWSSRPPSDPFEEHWTDYRNPQP